MGQVCRVRHVSPCSWPRGNESCFDFAKPAQPAHPPPPSATPQVSARLSNLHNSGRRLQTFTACERRGQTLDVLLRPWESCFSFQGSVRVHWETWGKKQRKILPGLKRQRFPGQAGAGAGMGLKGGGSLGVTKYTLRFSGSRK